MNQFERFVPDGCEFYQYREAMEDVRSFVPPYELKPVLFKSLTVRRKSDGHFFAMGWREDTADEDVQHEAMLMAEAAGFERVGGRRIDLGEANPGQFVRVAGDPKGAHDTIVCIDDAAKTYKLRTSNRVIPWSDARDP